MSQSIVQVLHIPAPAMPRGATLVGVLYSAFAALFQRAPAAASSHAEEAAAVRELADSVRNTDPGFASDLYAAAGRHEALNG